MNLIGRIIAVCITLAATSAAARAENAPPTAQGPTDAYESIAIRGHASTSTASNAPATPKRTPDTSLSATRIITSLMVVLAVIFGMKYAGKRFLGLPAAGAGGGAIQVLSRTMLAPRQQLVLVRLGRRILLLSHGGTQVSPLAQIDDPEEVAELLGQLSRKSTASFTNFFGRAHEKYDGPQVQDDPQQDVAESSDPAPKSDLAGTREEIGGLIRKVRTLSRVYSK